MNLARTLGYAGFFVFFFLVGLYFTFPWDAAKDRVFAMAEKESGLKISAESLSPSWVTGVHAEKVKVTLKEGETPIELDWVNARVSILAFLSGSLGGSVTVPLGEGEVDAAGKSSSDRVKLDVHAAGVDLAKVGWLIELAGLPLYGKVDLDTDLVLGKVDPKLTEGTLSFKTAGLGMEKGGKVAMIPVPDLELGSLSLSVPIKEGKAEFKNAHLAGTDLEVSIDGNLVLALPFNRTALNLVLGFKPTEKLLASDPLLKPILNNFQFAKDDQGFYGISLTGTIQHPRVQPRRR